MFYKLNSIIYNRFILEKLSIKKNQKKNFIILKNIVYLFSLFVFFIYCIVNENEIFHIAETTCAPKDYPDNTIWSSDGRKIFARAAAFKKEDAIAASCWNLNDNCLTLTIPRQKFFALKAHHVLLKIVLEDRMDFDRIPTRHANISDIMKTRSPNYIPVIRHYANLRNHLALTAEYNFLRNVEPDPYTHVNNYYAKTFDRHLKQFKENPNSVLENYELEYLDLLSEKMILSRNEAENIRLKYVTGRFYGKFLDFTTFRKAKMMELVDMLGLGSSS